MRYCSQCGAEIKEGTVFCPKCGGRVSENVSANVNANVAEPKKDLPRGSGGNYKRIIVVVLIIVVFLLSALLYYRSRFTIVGVWKLTDTDKEDVDLNSLDKTNSGDFLKYSLLTLSKGTRLVFTKDGELRVSTSLGNIATDLGTIQYTENDNDSITIKVSVNAVVKTISANYTCDYEFDGPDKLTIYVGGATLELKRDKDADIEDY